MAIFQPVLERLMKDGGRFVIVGGVAVLLHGHPRLTADLDLVIDLAPDAARRTIEAPTRFGLQPVAPVDPLDFCDPDKRRLGIKEKGLRVFSLYDPQQPLRIVDLFVEPPWEFEALWENARIVVLDHLMVRVASIPDLIRMKRLAGRPIDLEDIRHLEVLSRLRKEPGT